MIYFMPICELDQLEDQYLSWMPHLPPARREKLLRYRFAKDRWLCAAAYMLLLHGLQEEYGLTEDQIVMEIADSGKPYLSSHPHIYFNLSHCDAGAVCGISNVPIGIDVESVRRIDDRVVNRVLSASEQEILAHSKNPTLTFTTMWTLKESWVKYAGCGLVYPLKKLSIQTKADGNYFVHKKESVAEVAYSSNDFVIAYCCAQAQLHSEHSARFMAVNCFAFCNCE